MENSSLAVRAEERLRQISSLTGIRGIAALWVLLFHAQIVAETHGYKTGLPGHRFLDAGWTGVDLFFLLSGFMLMHSNGPTFATLRRDPTYNFFINRIFRVYPLASAALAIVLLLVVLDPAYVAASRENAPDGFSFPSFVKTAFLATRWVPMKGEWNEPVWSLSAELVGYAAFPMLAYLLLKCRSFYIAIGLSVAMIGGLLAIQYARGLFGLNDIGQTGALIRMAGCFTAGIAMRRAADLSPHTPSNRLVAAVGVLSILAIVVLAFGGTSRGFMAIPFATLIGSLFYHSGPVNWLLALRPVKFLGDISFPLYLVHLTPLAILAYHAQTNGLPIVAFRVYYLALLAGLSVLAWALHRMVERKTSRIAKRFTLPAATAVVSR